MNNPQILQARILVQRLERLSADSIWAHRASGVRAALDKMLAQIEAGNLAGAEDFGSLLQMGFSILAKAAQEIPVPEDFKDNH